MTKPPNAVKLHLQPISFEEACTFVSQYHRHHIPPQGHKFSLAVNDGVKVVGVVIVGNPVARHNMDGQTLEVTRLCSDGTPNVCSKLYRLAWNACQALGYTRLITYTLTTESGASLRAVGARVLYQIKSETWDRPNRMRVDKHETNVQRLLWEIASK